MKKIVSLLLVIILMVSIFAGCSQNSISNKPKFDMSKYVSYSTISWNHDGIIYLYVDYESATKDFMKIVNKNAFNKFCKKHFTEEEIEEGITLDDIIFTGNYDYKDAENISDSSFGNKIYFFMKMHIANDNLYDPNLEKIFNRMGVDFNRVVEMEFDKLPKTNHTGYHREVEIDMAQFVELEKISEGDNIEYNAYVNKELLLSKLIKCSPNDLDDLEYFENNNPEFYTSRYLVAENFSTRLNTALEYMNISVEKSREDHSYPIDSCIISFKNSENLEIVVTGLVGLERIFNAYFEYWCTLK